MNKKTLTVIISMALLGFSQQASAAITLLNPLCPDPSSPSCINSFPQLLTVIAGYLTGIIGTLATLIFIIAGIIFISSAGNAERTGRAKKMMLWAVIGIGIVLASNGLIAVVRAVLNVP